MLELNRTQKSYLRGAIWVAALVTVVLLPKVGQAQELSEPDKAINDIVNLRHRGPDFSAALMVVQDDRNEGLSRNFNTSPGLTCRRR